MISKETFIKVINKIIDVNGKLDKLNEANSYAADLVIYYSLQDELLDVLAESMNLPISQKFSHTLSWWVYETECGKESPYIWLSEDSKKENKLVLDTAEKLYDFCKKEGESNV